MKHNTKNQPSPLPHTGVKPSCMKESTVNGYIPTWQKIINQVLADEIKRRDALEHLPDRINDNNLCDGEVYQDTDTDSDILEAMENL